MRVRSIWRGMLILVISLSTVVCHAPQILAQGHTYYVATSGSDLSGDGSAAHPWRTIQHAAAQVAPGDTVLINPGTYDGGITVDTAGTATNPITFRAHGQGVVIDGSGGERDAFFITYADHIVVEGLTIRHANRAGMRVDNSDHVTVRGCTFADNTTWGLFTDFSDYLLIERNEAYGSVEQHGIYVSNSGDYPIIRGNRVHHNHACGIHMNADARMGGDGVISHGVVEANVIYDNGAGGGAAINMDGVTDTIVRNNLLYGNHAGGIAVFQQDGAVGSRNNRLLNNTIIMAEDGRWAINISQPSCINNQVFNNIIYSYHSWRGCIVIPTANLSGFQSDYNVVMDRFSADDDSSVITLSEWQELGYDANSLIAAPVDLFVDPSGQDYHLRADSPAVDAGIALPDVSRDLEGRARLWGAAYDIGAFEYAVELPIYLPLILKAWLAPVPTATPTSQPSPELEVVVLTAVMTGMAPDWWSPRIEVDTTDPSAISYRAVQPLMAGAEEYAEIVHYPSAAQAQAAFGTPDGQFHDMPSRQGSSSAYISAHYQDARWLEWIHGQRIYRAMTQYNSTYCGGARPPTPIAETLVAAAFWYDLIPLGPDPTPTPTATVPGYPWLSIAPLPCQTTSMVYTVTGTTAPMCDVIVFGGLEPVQVTTEAGAFAVEIDLLPNRAHHLEVASSWVSNQLYTRRTTDSSGGELLIWCVTGNTPTLTPSPTPALATSPTPTAEPGVDKWALWTEGTRLRGANVYQRRVYPEIDGDDFMGPGPIGPPYVQGDFDRLAAMGANYVNVSHPGLFTEAPPYVLDEAVQDNLDSLLDMIAEANMFAVISFRTGPGRSEFTFFWDEAGDWFDASYLNDSVWQDQAAQDGWVAMWHYTADRYRHNPIVVGYDLMVEPNSNEVGGDASTGRLDIWDPEEFYSTYGGTLYDWNQFHPRISSAVREVDANTPILIGGMAYSAVAWLPYLVPTGDQNTVYTVHQYEPHVYTHQEWQDMKFIYPGVFDTDWDGVDDQFDRTWLDSFLSIVDAFMATHDAPVAVNEFGVVRWVPGAADFMDDQMDLFEQRGMNHALWMWETSWPPYAEEVDAFNLRHGPDPHVHVDIESSDLMDVIFDYWERNAMRPRF